MKALITVVCILGLGAVVGAIFVGARYFDGTVTEHPYEHGLAWDSDCARRAASGIEVGLKTSTFVKGPGTVAFTVSARGPAGGRIGDRDVAVRVRRPVSPLYEKESPATRQSDGSWVAPIQLPVGGRWELTVLVDRTDGRIAFPAAIDAIGEETLAGTGGGCDLNRGPCTAALHGGPGTLTLEIAPRPVRTLRELDFTVSLACGGRPCAPREVAVALAMPGMYMGENTVRLSPAGAGAYRGRGAIVRCPSGRRVWQATVKAPPLGEAVFAFETDSP